MNPNVEAFNIIPYAICIIFNKSYFNTFHITSKGTLGRRFHFDLSKYKPHIFILWRIIIIVMISVKGVLVRG